MSAPRFLWPSVLKLYVKILAFKHVKTDNAEVLFTVYRIIES